ncbi:hypothetical protein K469DRAFT_752233 [Zopfia rhizophila CBS 207.26]|uniref:UBC core domain-containing protein n=1 Tax=Zopfia rhizophila CBS 207.26 TaxID=1314779 RepID=A0A6A6DR80_9PEZI|nr:hypothetical protein K469DRAFT_752233 [Zopfia rhizophila CBS 207.26]
MEAASLAVGAVALAGLFSNCLECFDLIEAGRNISRDLDIMLAKLDAQRVIFVIWGNAIGLHGGENTFNEDILGTEIQHTVYRLLSNLRVLFQDAERFRNRYGMKQVQSDLEPASTSKGALAVYQSRPHFGIFQLQKSWKAKLKWAIQDKKKFSVLLEDLKDLIQQLRDITQAAADLDCQRRALMAEVSAISDVQSLEILEEATMDDDPELSEVASQRILQLTEGSVTGTDLNRTLFTESLYRTARTHAYSMDFRSELDTVKEELYLTNFQEQEEQSGTAVDLSANDSEAVDASDFAFSQQNNLKSIQERDRLHFTNTQQDSAELHLQFGFGMEHLERMELNLALMDGGHGGHGQMRMPMIRKINRDLRRFYQDQPALMSIRVEHSNPRILWAAVQGPSGSVYEGGVFFMGILFPLHYPWSPPKCYFLTPIYHPNVSDNGEVLLDCLIGNWNLVWGMGGIESLLLAIISILHDPDWSNTCRQDVSFIHCQDPIGFAAVSRIHTQRYAQRTDPPDKQFEDYEFEIWESFKEQQISQATSKAAAAWMQLTIDNPDISKVLLQKQNRYQQRPLVRLQTPPKPPGQHRKPSMSIILLRWRTSPVVAFVVCIALPLVVVLLWKYGLGLEHSDPFITLNPFPGLKYPVCPSA